MGDRAPSPQEQVRSLYEQGEARAAEAAEQLVGRGSFGELLARITENTMAVTRIGNELLDLAVRNLRLAGRQDLNRLGRQLARTEDKLEMVLQEVERLEGRLDAVADASGESRDAGRRPAGRKASSGSQSKQSRAGSRSDGSSASSGQARSRRRRSGSSS